MVMQYELPCVGVVLWVDFTYEQGGILQFSPKRVTLA